MTAPASIRIFAAALVAFVVGASPLLARRRVNSDAATIAEFLKRVDGTSPHKKLDQTAAQAAEADDARGDGRARARVGKLIQETRKTAKPGDLFTPAMRRLVSNLLRPIFAGNAARRSRRRSSTRNPRAGEAEGERALSRRRTALDRPAAGPQGLPKLPEELQYRFIRTNLILFDPHAHIIADFMEHAFRSGPESQSCADVASSLRPLGLAASSPLCSPRPPRRGVPIASAARRSSRPDAAAQSSPIRCKFAVIGDNGTGDKPQ